MKTQPRGFSLIEVVIATAIIGLCAMLLLPFRAQSEKIIAQGLRAYEALWLTRAQSESSSFLPYDWASQDTYSELRERLGLVPPGQSTGVVRRQQKNTDGQRDYLVVDDEAHYVEYILRSEALPSSDEGGLYRIEAQWVPFGGSAPKEALTEILENQDQGGISQGRLISLGLSNPDLGWMRDPTDWGNQTAQKEEE